MIFFEKYNLLGMMKSAGNCELNTGKCVSLYFITNTCHEMCITLHDKYFRDVPIRLCITK